MSIIADFKEFAIKGNVLDMAVGIIVGVAFNKIVQSLVNDIFMPPLGMLIGGDEFKNLRMVLKTESVTEAGKTIPEVAIRYGAFINTCVEFFIVAVAAFIAVEVMSMMVRRRETETPAL